DKRWGINLGGPVLRDRLFSQWSDILSSELRYSRSRIVDKQDPIGGGEAQSDSPIPRFIVGIQTGTGANQRRGTVLAGPGTSRSANDLRTTIEQYKATANLDLGDHSLKGGVELNKANIFNLFLQNATGTLVFRNAAELEQGLLSPGLGNNQTSTTPNNVVTGQTEGAFGNFTPSGNVTEAAADFTRSIYSAYLQDDWRVTDRLSVVLGARTDILRGGRPDANLNFFRRYGFSNNTGFSDIDPVFLPRLAATYEIDQFSVLSRAQVRGGLGVFSGGDPLVWFGNAFQNDGSTFALGTTQAAGCPTGQIDVVVNGQFTGVPQCFRAAASATAAAGLGNTQSIDPDIKMPTVLRANIGMQAQLDLAPGFFSGWNVNLDYIFSRYRNPYTIVDLSQTPEITRGLAGFTIDGRPIYQAIDPTVANCTAGLVDAGAPPVYTGVNAACFNTTRFDELMLTNQDGYRSHIASFLLSKNFDGGMLTSGGSVYFNLGYAYTDAQDRRNMYNSTAGSNYDLTAAFDRQNPEASRGFYESRHNFTLSTSFTEQFFSDYDTRFGFTFVARSGRPYSLTFTGGGVFNNSNSGNDNALVYVPTGPGDPNISPLSNMDAVGQLANFLGGLDCAREYAGRTIERNTCTNDWFYDLDLTFSQELPGPSRLLGGRNAVRDGIRLYAMVDNFLNLLNDNWNVFRRRSFSGLQDVATLGTVGTGAAQLRGVDAQGRYIISGFNGQADFDADNQIQTSASVWRAKVGISYKF
ncbi:MAG TPA: TonB-dependent receptor, partial [Vicinamibacterales bacterium]|nr:TonB-dependent receptor [Vicinamibacterales bacterium]